jgi:hypothetical protein
MFEAARYDWSKLRARGSAVHIPADLLRLSRAVSEEEADAAYWQIDSVVVFQKSLFEAAAATAACIVTLVPTCTGIARARLLELLGQLGSGEPDPSEIANGNVALLKSIRREIERAFGYYVAVLQATIADRQETETCGYCIDLLFLCSKGDSEVKDRVRFYLQTIIDNRLVADELYELVINSLAEIPP